MLSSASGETATSASADSGDIDIVVSSGETVSVSFSVVGGASIGFTTTSISVETSTPKSAVLTAGGTTSSTL